MFSTTLISFFSDGCGSGKYSTDASHKTHTDDTHTHTTQHNTLYQNYILSEERLQESQGGRASQGGAIIADVDKQGTMRMDGGCDALRYLLAMTDDDDGADADAV